MCALVIFYGLQLAVYLCSAFMASPFAHVLTLLLAIWIYSDRSDQKPTEAVTDLPTTAESSVTTTTKGPEPRDEPEETSENDLDGSDNELQVSLSDENQ